MPTTYKIRRKADGLFSMGGTHPSFTKQGKVWNTLSSFTAHLKLVNAAYYDDCDVVTIEVTHREVDACPIADILSATKTTLVKKIAEQQAQRAAARERYEREQLAALQAKYPKP